MPLTPEFVKILITPFTFALVGAGVILAMYATPRLARRWQVGRTRIVLALVASVAIISITAPFSSLTGMWGAARNLDIGRFGWFYASSRSMVGWDLDREVALNVILFVPAGFGWRLVFERGYRIIIGLGVMSFTIESFQAVADQKRAGDIRDFFANTVGASVGVMIGALAASAIAGGSPQLAVWIRRQRSDPQLQRNNFVAALIVGILTLGATALVRDHATGVQYQLLQEIKASYATTTIGQARSAVHATSPDEFNSFTGRARVRPDYLTETAPNTYEARFTGPLGPAKRCVFATWRTSGVSVAPEHGSRCTAFHA